MTSRSAPIFKHLLPLSYYKHSKPLTFSVQTSVAARAWWHPRQDTHCTNILIRLMCVSSYPTSSTAVYTVRQNHQLNSCVHCQAISTTQLCLHMSDEDIWHEHYCLADIAQASLPAQQLRQSRNLVFCSRQMAHFGSDKRDATATKL